LPVALPFFSWESGNLMKPPELDSCPVFQRGKLKIAGMTESHLPESDKTLGNRYKIHHALSLLEGGQERLALRIVKIPVFVLRKPIGIERWLTTDFQVLRVCLTRASTSTFVTVQTKL
jgi:hypothetical protein